MKVRFGTRRGLGTACFARVDLNTERKEEKIYGTLEICPESVIGMSFLEEPSTRAVYPLEWCTRKGEDCESLAGMGVRSKNIIGIKKIKVYAVGIYVDPTDVKSKVRSVVRDRDSIAVDQKTFDDVLENHVKKTARIVIHYGKLTSKKLVSALRERCHKPLSAAGKIGDLEVFESWFENLHLKKGLAVAFSAENGMLVTRVEGKVIGQIDSPELCKALFDIYLGSDPVSKDAKEEVGRGISRLQQVL